MKAEASATSKHDRNNKIILEESGAKLSNAEKKVKRHFRPVPDDTKPLLQDPILRADPIETEEAVLRLPPFPMFITKVNSLSPK